VAAGSSVFAARRHHLRSVLCRRRTVGRSCRRRNRKAKLVKARQQRQRRRPTSLKRQPFSPGTVASLAFNTLDAQASPRASQYGPFAKFPKNTRRRAGFREMGKEKPARSCSGADLFTACRLDAAKTEKSGGGRQPDAPSNPRASLPPLRHYLQANRQPCHCSAAGHSTRTVADEPLPIPGRTSRSVFYIASA